MTIKTISKPNQLPKDVTMWGISAKSDADAVKRFEQRAKAKNIAFKDAVFHLGNQYYGVIVDMPHGN